jgi:DNA (cytosine-5)-methyltransferase 1
MLNGLDLFSGIGGCAEGLAEWVRPVAYCENDSAKQSMLVSRMFRGSVPTAPIWDDVRTLRGEILPEIDIISGGFPCTDLSLAGLREGLGAERSGLFWQIVRLTEEVAPCFVFLENVWPGVRKFVPTIRATFEALGFRCRDGVLAASDIGARHRRQRWFLLASNLNRISKRIQSGRRFWESRQETLFTRNALEDGKAPDSDSDSERMALREFEGGRKKKEPFSLLLLEGNNWDEYAAFFLRMDHGLPYRGHRIGALGDSLPPKQYRSAFKKLSGIYECSQRT